MKTLFDLLLIKAAEFLKALLKSIRFTALEKVVVLPLLAPKP